MECQDMIHLIISKGVTRRDLARFQAISRTWAKCCREAIKSLGQSYLVGTYDSHRCIRMFNLRTGEVHPLKLSPSLTSDLGNYWIRLLDSCEGLVLIALQQENYSCRLAVGNPCINQWKLLPKFMFIRHGTISRENDTLVITAMCCCGPLYEYNLKNDSWYRVTENVDQTEYCWWRGDYYSWFYGNPCIYDELFVRWVPLQRCNINVVKWFTVESNGRFFMYVLARDRRLRTFEVVNKNVVEVNVVEVVNKILSKIDVYWSMSWMVGSGDKLFWKEEGLDNVVCYSTLDNSSVTIDVTDRGFHSPVRYTDDGGVAFSRFMQRNWESKTFWTMKRGIASLFTPAKFIYMSVLCTWVCCIILPFVLIW